MRFLKGLNDLEAKNSMLEDCDTLDITKYECDLKQQQYVTLSRRSRYSRPQEREGHEL